MNYERKLLAAIRRADFNYNLINKGDIILIGVSGGKDSLALMGLLNIYRRFADKDFKVVACFLDLGFPKTDISRISKYAEELDMEFIIEDCQDVYPILNQHMTSKNILPCSICSRMKKASINAVAKRVGATKVCFGHHADDAIETLLMNMTHGGRIATFSPKMHLERADIIFIRPLIYAREKDIKGYAREKNLPVLKSTCGNDVSSERAEVKSILDSYYHRFPDAYDNFLTMLVNDEKFDLWFDDFGNADGEGLFIKKVRSYGDYIDSMKVRTEVFVKEQGIDYADEIDGTDSSAFEYYVAYKDNKPIGTVRIRQAEERRFELGRLAVLKEYRSQGIGFKLMRYVEKMISHKQAPITIELHAQERAVEFYTKLGYHISGERYEEVGIPHVPLAKRIEKPIMDKEKRK